MSEKVPQEFICPISMSLMKDPVMMEDGHTYEKECIIEWLSRSSYSPLTRQQITLLGMRSNYALAAAILRWQEEKKVKEVSKEEKEEENPQTYETVISIYTQNNPPLREPIPISSPSLDENNLLLRKKIMQVICLAVGFFLIIIISLYYMFIRN